MFDTQHYINLEIGDFLVRSKYKYLIVGYVALAYG